MIIDGKTLTDMSKGFNKIFETTFKELKPQTIYTELATVVNAPNSTTVEYGWLSDVPSMREWIGDREIKNLKAYGYTISKKDFEATVSVSRDDILFDRLGIVKPRIQDLAYAGRFHYDKLIIDLIKNNGVCYDGKNFFDEHIIEDPDGNQVSKFTNISTNSLSEDNLYEAMKTMRNITNTNGDPINVNPNIILVASNLEKTADKLIKAQYNSYGADNGLHNKFKVQVVPQLDDNNWVLMDTNKPLKPFILQITKPITFVSMANPQDESVFMKKEFRYGIDGMHNVGYALPHLAYYSDGSDS